MKIGDIANRLGRLDLHAMAQAALHEQAEAAAEMVREALLRPGDADQRRSVYETRALRESIGVSVAGDEVLIGSTSDAAVDRELGMTPVAPQTFLAPVAAEYMQTIGETIGMVIADALRRA